MRKSKIYKNTKYILFCFVILCGTANANDSGLLLPTNYNDFLDVLENTPIGGIFAGTLDRLVGAEYIPGSAFTMTKVATEVESTNKIYIPETDKTYYLKVETKEIPELTVSNSLLMDIIGQNQYTDVSSDKKFIIGDFINNIYGEDYYGNGGALHITSHVEKLMGSFVDNKANLSNALAINNGKIDYLQANFINNYSRINGGAINNSRGEITNINGVFLNNRTIYMGGGAIQNEGKMSNISGTFISNSIVGGSAGLSEQGGGAIFNRHLNVIGITGEMGGITADFFGNYVENLSDGKSMGGAIANFGTMGNITGDFSGNYALNNHNGGSYGGAIYNTGTMGDIAGNFSGNYVKATAENKEVFGGAIYNDAQIGDISGNFIANFADGTYAEGGAIYNTGTINSIMSEKIAQNEAWLGGAIYNNGTINNINSIFEENKNSGNSNFGGAIYNSKYIGTMSGAFISNSAEYGGAIYNNSNETGGISKINSLTNSSFESNSATMDGGAITNWAQGVINIGNTDFIDNTAARYGGAVSNDGEMTFTGTNYFSGNTSVDYGGAVSNSGKMTFTGTNYFIDNASGRGGAIHNTGTYGNPGEMVFNGDTVFRGNKADVLIDGEYFGGAILNDDDAKITFNGKTVFENNQSTYDIFNNGEIEFNGEVSLDGKLTTYFYSLGTSYKTGKVTFGEGTVINAVLDKTFIGQHQIMFNGNNTINMFVDGTTTEGRHQFLDTGFMLGGFEGTPVKNALYNMTAIDKYIDVKLKTGNELLADTPATLQQANAIIALMKTNGNGTEQGNNITKSMSYLMQSDYKDTAVQGIKDLAPTTSQMVMGIANSVNNALYNITSDRLNGLGRSGGDVFVGGSAWVQGFYNYSKQNQTSNNEGFAGNIKGISLGVDGKLTNSFMMGIGYGYINSDVEAENRNTDVDGHNIFAYLKYQPNKWFLDSMLNYGLNKYTENKTPFGYNLESEYKVNTYAVNVRTGYDFDNGITPELGLRYLLAKQKPYNDGVQNITVDDMNMLTGVLGGKYTHTFVARNWQLKPIFNLGITYDLISDKVKSDVTIINGGQYQIIGNSLETFGLETGIGINTIYNNNWTLSLRYSGNFRKDFQSHTGMLQVKYSF